MAGQREIFRLQPNPPSTTDEMGKESGLVPEAQTSPRPAHGVARAARAAALVFPGGVFQPMFEQEQLRNSPLV